MQELPEADVVGFMIMAATACPVRYRLNATKEVRVVVIQERIYLCLRTAL